VEATPALVKLNLDISGEAVQLNFVIVGELQPKQRLGTAIFTNPAKLAVRA
jgi:hypothetical protein